MRNASSLGLSSGEAGPGPGRPALPRDVACSRLPWTEKGGPLTLVSVGRHGGTTRRSSDLAAPVGSALACAAGARLARARSGLLFQQAPCVCTSASVELGERRFFKNEHLQRELRHQLLILPPEAVNLCPRGVPHRRSEEHTS